MDSGASAEPLRLERYSKDAIRVMRGGEVVGMLLRHCDDRWSVNDTRERPLMASRHFAPKVAFRRACEARLFEASRAG